MHTNIGQNGRELVCGIVIFACDDHYRPMNAMRACDLCTFSGYLMGETLDKQLSHNRMTQIASVLAVAAVYIFLYLGREGGLYVSQNTSAGT